MAGVRGEHIGAHQQQADAALRTSETRQFRDVFGDLPRQTRVIEPDIGIMHRFRAFAEPPIGGVARDEVADQAFHILGRPGEQIAHAEEIGAHILRGAGDEAQDLGQAAQQRHLPCPGRFRPFGAAAQPLQDRERAARLLVHAEFAKAGELDHFAGRQAAHHGEALLAPRLQRVDHRQIMIFQKQHMRDDDVRARDVRIGHVCRAGIVRPAAGHMDRQAEARQRPRHAVGRLFEHRRQMRVQGDDHHVQRRALTGHNAPSLRTAYRA